MTNRMIVGMTGASGAIYGIRLLQMLKTLKVEAHLVMSQSAEVTLAHETVMKVSEVRQLADQWYKIDDIAAAGMDTTRIDGINFTVEDSSPYMAELREAAVIDALAKAGHFAQLTGISVGPLTFISEIGSGTPGIRDFQESGFTRMAVSSAPTTAISSGELELNLNIQAVFEIK